MPDFVWLMVILVAVAVSAVIFWILGSSSQKKKTEETIGKAEDKARSIIDEALKTAEAKKREALLEVKKNPFVPRMNLTRKSRNAGQKRKELREDCSKRKRTSIKKQMHSKNVSKA